MNYQGAKCTISEGMRKGMHHQMRERMEEGMLYHELSRGSFNDSSRGSFKYFGGDALEL